MFRHTWVHERAKLRHEVHVFREASVTKHKKYEEVLWKKNFISSFHKSAQG